MPVVKDKILVIGASGQIGVELTLALRKDMATSMLLLRICVKKILCSRGSGPYVSLDVMNKEMLHVQVIRQILPRFICWLSYPPPEKKNPNLALAPEYAGLIECTGYCQGREITQNLLAKQYCCIWPYFPKQHCPQQTIIEPSTVYGISKYAGEFWCNYFHNRYGVDVRSLRYPGLISYKSEPGGGTTDYAIEIFNGALEEKRYRCFLKEDTFLPMMYMPDAIRATLELMDAPADKISVRTSYNISGMSFSPKEIGVEI